ncbi:MAG TPA: hypothetical protein VF997_17225, partial [Polyangia bacterium]
MRSSSTAAAALSLTLTLAACRAAAPMLPIVPTPAEQLPPLADILRTCAFEVSCLRSPPASTLSGCLYYFMSGLDDWIVPGGFMLDIPGSEFRRYVACAVDNVDCTSVLECASRGHGPAYCAAHPGTAC